MSFNSKDVAQIEAKGIKLEEVLQQITIFKRGNLQVNLLEAATLKNGIISFSKEEKEKLINLYEDRQGKLKVLKFVPASGAATRMFKALYTFLKEYKTGEESVEQYIERKNNPKLELFFGRMTTLPFYEKVKQKIFEVTSDFEELSKDEQQILFVKTMLNEQGLNLGNLPKGLVPFHKYSDHLATAFEEHLIEAASYVTTNKEAHVHFTVAENQLQKFEKEFNSIRSILVMETGVEFNISYSFQDSKTDTIALDKDNELFREEHGELFFRPGGHGALINNLNEQDADLVFIKNIDNVVIPKYRELVIENKKMLAGKLLQLQEKTFRYLDRLEKGEVEQEEVEEMIVFLQKELYSGLSIHFEDLETAEKITVLKKKFNLPMRICGMVKNEGEPGGGPFWVKHKTGEISLQIVENSQIDHDNYQQSKIAQEATHFNPVDIVCSFKNYKGAYFDLHKYVDRDTSFISQKTRNGKELKALEHPGLWNGGMANWISIFVEVPVETFNPVKTVADLLKPTHQVRL